MTDESKVHEMTTLAERIMHHEIPYDAKLLAKILDVVMPLDRCNNVMECYHEAMQRRYVGLTGDIYTQNLNYPESGAW